jgi:hypothetical protein
VNSFSLTFKAGNGALESIRKHGFDLSSVGTIAGASGGAKWLVLSQLDRAILSSIVPKLSGPIHLIGSSIGSWRFACYAQADPIAAVERFEQAYLEQTYSQKPDIHEITAKSREILDFVLGANGATEILENPLFRTHVIAVRSRHVMASENKFVLAGALLAPRWAGPSNAPCSMTHAMSHRASTLVAFHCSACPCLRTTSPTWSWRQARYRWPFRASPISRAPRPAFTGTAE